MLKKSISIALLSTMILATAATGFAATGFAAPQKFNAAVPQKDIQGKLVIVGGALGSTNQAVYGAFIEAAGGKDNARIGIVPAASGGLKSSNSFKNDLVQYGLSENNVTILPLAVTDDSKTKDVDESKWIENAGKKEVADQISGLTGVWFVGGDQTRITKALMTKDGKQSLALQAIWGLYKKGGVIGGTSAGAAIMSQPMIAGGNSLGAINNGFTDKYIDENDQLNGPVYLENGLGFFQYGIVDQHFDARARLGRLAVTAFEFKKGYKRAYGVDENTAMVFNAKDKTFTVAGAGGVTVVDVTAATKKAAGKQYAYDNIAVSFVSPGDSYNVESGAMKVSDTKDSTKGYEYYDIKGNIQNTGVFSGYNTVKNFVMYNLVDNASGTAISSYCFDEKGMGARILFKKDAQTEGWWGYQDGNIDSYSAKNVKMSIQPVSVKVTPVK